jgi:hypothetical protein
MPSTARIERAPFHRARSASKEGTWPLPPHPSEPARCASTEDHQAPSRPLFCEQEERSGCSLAAPFPHIIIFSTLREMWDKDDHGGRMPLAEHHHAMQTVQ